MLRWVTVGFDEGGADDGFFDGAGFDDGCDRFGWGVDSTGLAGLEGRATIRDGDVDTEEHAAAIAMSTAAIDVFLLPRPAIALTSPDPSAPSGIPRTVPRRRISSGNGLDRPLSA